MYIQSSSVDSLDPGFSCDRKDTDLEFRLFRLMHCNIGMQDNKFRCSLFVTFLTCCWSIRIGVAVDANIVVIRVWLANESMVSSLVFVGSHTMTEGPLEQPKVVFGGFHRTPRVSMTKEVSG